MVLGSLKHIVGTLAPSARSYSRPEWHQVEAVVVRQELLVDVHRIIVGSVQSKIDTLISTDGARKILPVCADLMDQWRFHRSLLSGEMAAYLEMQTNRIRQDYE